MSNATPHSLFCFGYGYCCEWLGAAQLEAGWRVAGTTRDPEKRLMMKERGIRAFLFDEDKPLEDAGLFLKGVTHLLISTPPGDTGDPTFLMHGEDILKCESLKWVGYLSSTSVYGDRGGEWVSEESEPHPTSKRGTRRLRAEEQWLDLCYTHNLPVHIFRLAGIYGPGRSVLDAVRAGIARRISKPGHAFSRIHVEDIVAALRASMENPNPGRVYNLADDRAAPSHEVIKWACDLLGLEAPLLLPYEEADLAPITRSFYADNKRIKNDRIKKELGITLRYPDYLRGVEACLAWERAGSTLPLMSHGGGGEG